MVLETIFAGETEAYLPVVILSAIGFAALFPVSRYILCPLLMPQLYGKFSTHHKYDWDKRVVSIAFCVYATVSAVGLLQDKELQADPVWSKNEQALTVAAVATGYFLYDIFLCLINFKEEGGQFLVHAVTCFTIYFMVLRPFLPYYSAVFLLFEVSTIFLNFHFMLERTSLNNSVIHLANGILLLGLFFFFRIVFGLYQSYFFFQELVRYYDRIPTFMLLFYTGANFLLNSLNLFWFSKMIAKLVRHATGKNSGAKKHAHHHHNHHNQQSQPEHVDDAKATKQH